MFRRIASREQNKALDELIHIAERERTYLQEEKNFLDCARPYARIDRTSKFYTATNTNPKQELLMTRKTELELIRQDMKNCLQNIVYLNMGGFKEISQLYKKYQ